MIIHSSPLADVEIPKIAITSYVLQEAARVPDREALIDGPTGRSYTYAKLSGMIHAFAGGLQARGLGPRQSLAGGGERGSRGGRQYREPDLHRRGNPLSNP